MAGELERRRPTQPDLDAEGARLGENFGLGGPCQGAFAAQQRPGLWGIGALVAGTGAFLAVFVVPPLLHTAQLVLAIIAGAGVVIGLALMAVAPRSRWDRLYWFPDGIAQRVSTEPEPKILRWADVTAVRVGFSTGGDDSPVLARCLVDGPAGVLVEADGGYKSGLAAFAREAEQVMAARVLPGLTAACDRGEPVVFGELTITGHGLTVQPEREDRESWKLTWSQIQLIIAHGPGRALRVYLPPRGRKRRWIGLELVPNGFLAHHVIEHVAAAHDLPVTVQRE
jgi:hypothetical protein